MNLQKKFTSLALIGFMGLSLPYRPFLAKDRKAEIRAATDEAKGTFSLRNFLGKKAALGSGKVTAKSASTLTVVGKDGKTYTVLTDDKTKYRRRFWGKSTFDEISVNDEINVIGKWADDARSQIQAKLIRDLSIQRRAGVFFGTVDSLTASGWIMKTVERGMQTVTVDSSTKFIDRRERTISRSDVVVGHRVRLRGLWDATNKTITEVTEVKDFSLPGKSSPSPSPTATP